MLAISSCQAPAEEAAEADAPPAEAPEAMPELARTNDFQDELALAKNQERCALE